MIDYFLVYLVMITVFLLMDFLWLGVLAKSTYQKYLGHLMREHTNWLAAIAFYLFFVLGILFFAVIPANEKMGFNYALLYGAFFGFFTYMTFELTALSVLKGWKLTIVFIDIIWGILISAFVAMVGFWVLGIMR